jgi:hypothetical protein
MLQPPRRKRIWRRLGSLFREARRLERRRRRRYAAAIGAGCAIAAGGGLAVSNGGGGPSHAGESRIPPLVSSLALPRSGDFFALGVVGGRVIVSGGPSGSLFPSGSSTVLVNGRAAGTCDAATVTPGTVRIGRVRRANCGDPALYGERVLAVSYLERPATHSPVFAVRIAHVDPAARDGYTLGPVVMRYSQCSDCSAQWIYGDGSLWLYGHGELLRVSETTGRVVQRWAVPPDPEELIAVDADGLWFAPSVVGGHPLHTPASQLIRFRSLYRVTPGANAPNRVFTIPHGNALWLVAAGHTVWLESRGPHSRVPFELWRLQGQAAKPTYHGTYPTTTYQGVDNGDVQPTHAGNAALGIYFVNNPGIGSQNANEIGQQVVALSPGSATQRTVATIQPRTEIESDGEGPPAVAVGRSFYFLDPALLNDLGGGRPAVVQGRGVLYRVTPGPIGRRSRRWPLSTA